MRVSSINSTNFYRANFNKANNNTVPVYKEINAKELDALSFTGISGQYGVKKYVPQEVQSAIDEFRETDRSIRAYIKNMEITLDEAEKNTFNMASEIYKYGQDVYNEIMELYEKGDEIAPDGTILRRITQKDNIVTMEEFDKNGKLKRKSELDKEYHYIQKHLTVKDDIESTEDGSEKIGKEMRFLNGKMRKYLEDQEKHPDGSEKIGKDMSFDYTSKTIKEYIEDYEKHPDGIITHKKAIYFDSKGKLNYYREGYKEFGECFYKLAKEVLFYEGKQYAYIEGVEIYPNHRSNKNAKLIGVANGEPTLYREIPDDKITKEINYEYGLPKTYMENLTRSANGVKTMAKEIKFENGIASEYSENLKQPESYNHEWETGKLFRLTDKGWKKVK